MSKEDKDKKVIDIFLDNFIGSIRDDKDKPIPNGKASVLKRMLKLAFNQSLKEEHKYYSGEKYELVNAARNNDLDKVKKLVEDKNIQINTYDDSEFYKDPVKETDMEFDYQVIPEAILFYGLKNKNQDMINYRLSKSPELTLQDLVHVIKPLFKSENLDAIEALLENVHLKDMVSYDTRLHDYTKPTPTELEREAAVQKFKELPLPKEFIFRKDHYTSNIIDGFFTTEIIMADKPNIKMAKLMIPHLLSSDHHIERIGKTINFPEEITQALKDKSKQDKSLFKRNLTKKAKSNGSSFKR